MKNETAVAHVRTELPWSLHSSRGWRAQFERANRWYDRLIRTTNPQDAEDYLYAFFQAYYHLREWLLVSGYDRSAIERLFAERVELRLCQDLCNLTKHFRLTRTPAMEIQPVIVREYVGPGRGWCEDDSVLVVLSRGAKYDARQLASSCLGLWMTLLESDLRRGSDEYAF
ncbi:MAG: hypothetical protein ACKVVP_06225 [Chloroflexota bacterium]